MKISLYLLAAIYSNQILFWSSSIFLLVFLFFLLCQSNRAAIKLLKPKINYYLLLLRSICVLTPPASHYVTLATNNRHRPPLVTSESLTLGATSWTRSLTLVLARHQGSGAPVCLPRVRSHKVWECENWKQFSSLPGAGGFPWSRAVWSETGGGLPERVISVKWVSD